MPLDVIGNGETVPGDDHTTNQLATILSAEEIDRSTRFAFENSRREYIAAHALCRVMLSTFSDTLPTDWRFATGPHGRPEITGPEAADKLRFNISHTRGMVCVAVTLGLDIGVDVEWTGRDNQLDDIARAKFSKPEVALLADLPGPEKRDVFFSLWTLKEAYIKAIGKGLAEPLDGFAFSLDPPGVEFLNAQDTPQHWRFESRQPAADYRSALAVNTGAGKSVQIIRQTLDIVEFSRLL
mgnify:CR=1 FL=1